MLMVKLLGSALVVGSTTAAGWQVAGRYAGRPRQLRDLQTGLAVLQTEIEYGATPLPEALEAAARAAAGPVGAILAGAAAFLREGGGITPGEALTRAAREAGPVTCLAADDLDALLALAPVLGATGRLDQVRHLALARERLAGEEARAADERMRYERLARYAGVLAGAALVFIFF